MRSAVMLLLLVAVSFADFILSPTDSRVRYDGRWFISPTDSSAQSNWPGCSFTIRFQNSANFSAVLDGDDSYRAYIDGAPVSDFTAAFSATKTTYVTGIAPGTHVLQVMSIGESGNHNYWRKFIFDDGVTILNNLTDTRTHKILFVGDSHTAGMNDALINGNCIEDFTLTYAYLTSQHFNAQFQAIAASGKGLIHNNGDTNTISGDAMANYLYYKTFSHGIGTWWPDPWDQSKYIADAVVVLLGTNDYQFYNDQYDPTIACFDSAMQWFTDTLRNDHPGAPIFWMSTSFYRVTAAVIPGADSMIKAGEKDVHLIALPLDSEECGSHPGRVANQIRAQILEDSISAVLGWSAGITGTSKSSETLLMGSALSARLSIRNGRVMVPDADLLPGTTVGLFSIDGRLLRRVAPGLAPSLAPSSAGTYLVAIERNGRSIDCQVLNVSR